jgi:hypothetical protein
MDTYEGNFNELTILQLIDASREKVTTEEGKKNKIAICEKLVEDFVYNTLEEPLKEYLRGSGPANIDQFLDRLKPENFNLTPFLHCDRRNPYLRN